MWLRWKLTPNKSGEFNDKTIWRLYVGIVQYDMKYYWTSDEIMKKLNKFKKKQKKKSKKNKNAKK